MDNIDFKFIEDYNKKEDSKKNDRQEFSDKEIDLIQSKGWPDLTITEIGKIKDTNQKRIYKEKFRFFIANIIPAILKNYKGKNLKNFKLEDDMTCNEMLEELKKLYRPNQLKREEIINIITSGNCSKK